MKLQTPGLISLYIHVPKCFFPRTGGLLVLEFLSAVFWSTQFANSYVLESGKSDNELPGRLA